MNCASIDYDIILAHLAVEIKQSDFTICQRIVANGCFSRNFQFTTEICIFYPLFQKTTAGCKSRLLQGDIKLKKTNLKTHLPEKSVALCVDLSAVKLLTLSLEHLGNCYNLPALSFKIRCKLLDSSGCCLVCLVAEYDSSVK